MLAEALGGIDCEARVSDDTPSGADSRISAVVTRPTLLPSALAPGPYLFLNELREAAVTGTGVVGWSGWRRSAHLVRRHEDILQPSALNEGRWHPPCFDLAGQGGGEDLEYASPLVDVNVLQAGMTAHGAAVAAAPAGGREALLHGNESGLDVRRVEPAHRCAAGSGERFTGFSFVIKEVRHRPGSGKAAVRPRVGHPRRRGPASSRSAQMSPRRLFGAFPHAAGSDA